MASHRRVPQPRPAVRTTRVTVLSAAVAAGTVLSGGTAQIAAADPSAAAGQNVETRLDRVYQQAEQATEKYDAARERAGQLRADFATLQDRAARDRQQVNELRGELGTLAAEQYRGGALDPSLALLLSDDPDGSLDRAAALDRLGAQQSGRLRELQDAEKALSAQRTRAAGKLAELDAATAELRRCKAAVQQALTAGRQGAQRLPADHPGMGDHRAPTLPPAGLLGLPPASGRAALALAAARQALGSPYAWGADGPHSFDCSGLMQYAYGRAGVALPRTSQEQMNAGRRIPLSQARPGDLVVYRRDAGHVAMYAGAGRVIHAPYPGARVRYDPVDMMPITAVTRP